MRTLWYRLPGYARDILEICGIGTAVVLGTAALAYLLGPPV